MQNDASARRGRRRLTSPPIGQRMRHADGAEDDSRCHAPASADTSPQKSGAGLSILGKLPVPVLIHSGDGFTTPMRNSST